MIIAVAIWVIFIISPIYSFAQQDAENKTVTLVVSGEGSTKEEATKKALRSAIEQTFGTFVSANTQVLNDELIKDEIVTISSGNIQSYKEISYSDEQDFKSITLQATVSIGKLVTYAKSKGMSCDLAGATFIMNKKIRSLNKMNEAAAINHLMDELEILSIKGLYDFDIEVSDPKNYDGRFFNTNNKNYFKYKSGYNTIDIHVKATLNKNGDLFFKKLISTLHSLSLTQDEINEYNSLNEDYCQYNIGGTSFSLRNRYIHNYTSPKYGIVSDLPISVYINKSLLGFVVKDNLGNEYRMGYKRDYNIDKNYVIPSNEFKKSLGEYENERAFQAKETNLLINGEVYRLWAYYPFAHSWSIDDFLDTHTFFPQSFQSEELKIANCGQQNLVQYPKEETFHIHGFYSDADIEKLNSITVEPSILNVDLPTAIPSSYNGIPKFENFGTKESLLDGVDDDLSTFCCTGLGDYFPLAPGKSCNLSYIAVYNGDVQNKENDKYYMKIADYVVYLKSENGTKKIAEGCFENTNKAQYIDLNNIHLGDKDMLILRTITAYKDRNAKEQYDKCAVSEVVGYGR